jgi:hypothetical protein
MTEGFAKTFFRTEEEQENTKNWEKSHAFDQNDDWLYGAG